MTVVVTRDVADRFRGFLASCMLEIAPGVYTSPQLNSRVREKIWVVLQEWFTQLGGGSILMTWYEKRSSGSQQIRCLGIPPVELVDADGLILSRRPLTSQETERLAALFKVKMDSLIDNQSEIKG
ncbi:MAG: type I-E CRISPR-associated endoribonuclease Cas2 [Magnetococcales bacterium]|nr:type I-E CRISPR-associated endoribonuclease Cas2 [Magnetococcales bacterium]